MAMIGIESAKLLKLRLAAWDADGR